MKNFLLKRLNESICLRNQIYHWILMTTVAENFSKEKGGRKVFKRKLFRRKSKREEKETVKREVGGVGRRGYYYHYQTKLIFSKAYDITVLIFMTYFL